jgi:hypothetical protein
VGGDIGSLQNGQHIMLVCGYKRRPTIISVVGREKTEVEVDFVDESQPMKYQFMGQLGSICT